MRLITFDELLATYWRETNREWRDKAGNSRDYVLLFPELDNDDTAKWIPAHDSAVFYSRAVDLVRAFDDFGYQIFEPNVRAHIRKSKVNAAIKFSLLHALTRKEFRFLNNGVTITCRSFRRPSQNSPYFRVREPGVVNGLQTVIAMHEAYTDLPEREQQDFEKKCYVLVRLLRENAVDDVNRVVLATNTQNPMQARNLRSNTEEQVLYERLFAQQLSWFYERKQGAWDAFSRDPTRWRTLANYRKSRFLVEPSAGSGRRRERRIDNEILAQTWLSFIGFSNDAVHRKGEIFDDEVLYELTFLTRTRGHGQGHEFSLDRAVEEADSAAPAPELMLVTFFARELARSVPLKVGDAREDAVARLGLDRTMPREELDAELAKDASYLRNRVLNGMSYLFVEFLGYILFSAFGSAVHDIGPALLRTKSLKTAKELASVEHLTKAVREEQVGDDDLLSVAWFAFDHIIDQLLGGSWKQSYLTAPNRTRFNYSKETRSRLYETFLDLEAYMQRSQLTKAWTAHIPPQTPITTYFKNVIVALSA